MTVAGGKMKKLYWMVPAGFIVVGAAWILQGAGGKSDKIDSKDLLTGQQAFSDYQKEKPGLFHKITASRSSETVRHEIEREFSEGSAEA